MQKAAQGTIGQAHLYLNGFVIGPDEIVERESETMFFRHRTQDHQHFLAQFLLLDFFMRARRKFISRATLVRLALQRPLVNGKPPAGVDGDILGDPQQPGAKFVELGKLPERPVGDQQRFLKQILRLMRVACFQIKPGEHQTRAAERTNSSNAA